MEWKKRTPREAAAFPLPWTLSSRADPRLPLPSQVRLHVGGSSYRCTVPLYALVDGQRQRALKDGPRRASCAECGEPMLARTGEVLIWHWAHVEHNPYCEAARESQWHLAWKERGIDGTQEITVGPRRADILAPGGFAVEFQASALERLKVWTRETDWAAHHGMVWVFKADEAFAAKRITMVRSFAGYEKYLSNPEPQTTLDVTWSHAPERVRAARAPSFLDLGTGELLFIGCWRHGSSPLTGYGWRVTRDAVVRNVLRGTTIPAPIAGDPAETIRKVEAWRQGEAERKTRRRREEQRREAERQDEERRRQVAAREREEQQRREAIQLAARQAASQAEPQQPVSRPEPPPRGPARSITQKLRQWRLRRGKKQAAPAERAAHREIQSGETSPSSPGWK